jgi:hypothetical protein
MRFRLAACASAFVLVTLSAPVSAAITFSTFVSSADLSGLLSNNATIGFAYAGDRFVGSVYFGTNNNQLYQTNLTGGGIATFGAPLFAGPGSTNAFSGEIYVNASLGIGSWGSQRDVYAGSQSFGTVVKVAHNGSSQSVFTTGLSGGVRSIGFDPFGLYGNDMIVATNAGNVYRVTSAGVATLLANTGEDTEGISFAPQAFGSFAAGTLFVASEGSGTLRAISPTGTITPVITGLGGAEMVSFVPTNIGASGNPVEGFYAADYAVQVIKAGASQFVPFIGDAIITGETGHQVWDVKCTASTCAATVLGSFPDQPEDGIFVTADIIRQPIPEPSTFALMLAGLGITGWVARRRR